MNMQAEEIHLSYGAKEILKGVSLDVHKKEFVGLIGPNGSGKSTLLKCIYRVLEPSGGCIRLDGEEMKKISYRDSAKKMAVLAQHNYYNFEFSVREVVLMGRAPHKRALERDNARDYEIVEEALKTVGMYEFIDRDFSTLSGGEQQRVILARALAQQTPCLVLDEPTNHLDITHQLQLMRLVKQLDVTVISAIHDLNIAAMFCDRLYVLKDGEIITSGKTEDILTRELIYDIYNVETEIVKDHKGQIHILFL
jgi:iron complex transport system ATP-binding protein